MKFLGHWVDVCLIFKETARFFPKVIEPLYAPSDTEHKRVLVVPHARRPLVLPVFIVLAIPVTKVYSHNFPPISPSYNLEGETVILSVFNAHYSIIHWTLIMCPMLC